MIARNDRFGAVQTPASASPTDARILAVLADGPLPTAAIADGLGTPERTIRHRLMRLRQSGRVVTLPDGRHGVAGSGDAPAAREDGPAVTLPDGRHGLAGSVQAPAARQNSADETGRRDRAAADGEYSKLRFLLAFAAAAAIAGLVRLAANGSRPAPPVRPAAGPPYPGWRRAGGSW